MPKALHVFIRAWQDMQYKYCMCVMNLAQTSASMCVPNKVENIPYYTERQDKVYCPSSLFEAVSRP